MNLLKNLKINGLKEIKGIGLRSLRIDGLKDIILKPRHARDKDIKGLTKSREEIKKKIKELVKEKKEIESQIVQLQKTGEEKNEEISGSPKQEKEIIEKADNFDELKKTGEEEKTDNIGIKTEVIEAKSDSKRGVAEGSGIVDLNSSVSKKVEEIVFPSSLEKTISSTLQENKEDRISETSKTKSEKPAPGILGGSLIEELMESEDLYPEEEQNFMKYIEESSVTELVTNLKEVKELLA
ncbi:hypothetical protein [Methanosarcina sp. UBA5]|uniref:hypothetical protein n=1 Tax=Methanosarcina sp. UBA5 TaxID=1915593 RepID=UPI0025E85361|nr:hypothetical protein [Methanosarcina sp. UBA5]